MLTVANQSAELLQVNDSLTTVHNEKPRPEGTGAKSCVLVRPRGGGDYTDKPQILLNNLKLRRLA